jgi:mRNA-degrading endonuclease RelE of RelBE toxin-antitoxin system
MDLGKIDRDQARDILLALTDYVRTGMGDVRRLKGSSDWRLRVGDYRVRFEILPGDVFRILHVKHRREAYR